MDSLKTGFSIEIPIQIENLKFFCFVSQKTKVSGPASSYPHNHGNFYELRYVAAGSYTQMIEDVPLNLIAGDTVLIHPLEYHYQTEQMCDANLLQYSLRFFIKPPSEDAAPDQKKAYVKLKEMLDSIRTLHDENLLLLPHWEKLMDEFSKKEYGYFTHLQAMCMLIINDFLRLSDTKSTHVFPSKELRHSFYWRDQLDSFLRLRYMDNVKLQDIANAIGLSTRQVSRVFLREFGVSFVNKLNEVRLQQAKFLLTHTHTDIYTICTDCGFQSMSYFTAKFRKNTGMTPAEYRNRNAKAISEITENTKTDEKKRS